MKNGMAANGESTALPTIGPLRKATTVAMSNRTSPTLEEPWETITASLVLTRTNAGAEPAAPRPRKKWLGAGAGLVFDDDLANIRNTSSISHLLSSAYAGGRSWTRVRFHVRHGDSFPMGSWCRIAGP